MRARVLRGLIGVAAAWLLSSNVASAQPPMLAQPAVSGNTVTFVWTATAGASSYRLDYGVTSGVYIGNLALGNVTTFQIGAPNGVFAIRVVALPGGEASNEITLQVPAPPAAPTGLSVSRNGTGVAATWNPGMGGGSIVGYRLIAALTPGGADFVIPTIANAFGGGPAPANTYYFSVVAYNAAGQSARSNEVQIMMPGGGACDAGPLVPLSTFAFSGYLSISWPAIGGATQYVLSAKLNGVEQGPFGLPASVTRIGQVVPLGTYTLSVRAVMSCGGQSPDNPVDVVNDGSAPPGPRTANPTPGQLLAVPGYGLSVVNSVAAARPDLLLHSCVEHGGGNNRFMFEVVRELRNRDTRWGLNWKRGLVNDLSQDIVAFNRSHLPDEGATSGPTGATQNISIFDMIGNHCGSRPTPNWQDQTGATIAANARAVWTLLPYIAAGYRP